MGNKTDKVNYKPISSRFLIMLSQLPAPSITNLEPVKAEATVSVNEITFLKCMLCPL